jgi:coatomer subunit epsilon
MTAGSEPDELYTLRAQYSLGHYAMALDECKSLTRRPMSPALKAEREEYVLRAQIALKQFDKVKASSGDSVGECRVMLCQLPCRCC